MPKYIYVIIATLKQYSIVEDIKIVYHKIATHSKNINLKNIKTLDYNYT